MTGSKPEGLVALEAIFGEGNIAEGEAYRMPSYLLKTPKGHAASTVVEAMAQHAPLAKGMKINSGNADYDIAFAKRFADTPDAVAQLKENTRAIRDKLGFVTEPVYDAAQNKRDGEAQRFRRTPAHQALNWIFRDNPQLPTPAVISHMGCYEIPIVGGNVTAYGMTISEVLGIPNEAIVGYRNGRLAIKADAVDAHLQDMEARITGKTQNQIEAEVVGRLLTRSDPLADALYSMTGVDWLRNADTNNGLHYRPAAPILNADVAQAEIQGRLDKFNSGLKLAPRSGLKPTELLISLPAPPAPDKLQDIYYPPLIRMADKAKELGNMEAVEAAQQRYDALEKEWRDTKNFRGMPDQKALAEKNRQARVAAHDALEAEKAKAYVPETLNVVTPQSLLETLGTISRLKLKTNAKWTYDEKKDEFHLPFDHPPKKDAPAEYTRMIKKLRDELFSELREDCEHGTQNRPAAGTLVRTDKEIILRKPNVMGILDQAEQAQDATPVTPSHEPQTELMLARMLPFTKEDGSTTSAFGKWQIHTDPLTKQHTIRMAARPAPSIDSHGFDADQMARDLNFTVGGEFNKTAVFSVEGSSHNPFLVVRDIEPLLFDESLDALRATAKSWVSLTEERRQEMREAMASNPYTPPPMRAPRPEDVKLLNGLKLKDGLPPGMIISRKGGDVFEYVEKEDGTKVLRVPIFVDGPMAGGLANELSNLLGSATGSRLEANVKREMVPFVPGNLDNLSTDSHTAMLAMRDGVEANWVDKALGQHRNLPGMATPAPRKVTYVEISAIAENTDELKAMMPPLANMVAAVGVRVKATLDRAEQKKTQAGIS